MWVGNKLQFVTIHNPQDPGIVGNPEPIGLAKLDSPGCRQGVEMWHEEKVDT